MRYIILTLCWLLFTIPLFISKHIAWPAQQLFILIDVHSGLVLFIATWFLQLALLEFYSRKPALVWSSAVSLLMLFFCLIVTPRLAFFTDTIFSAVYRMLGLHSVFSDTVANTLYYAWFYVTTVTLDTVFGSMIASFFVSDIARKPFFFGLYASNALILACAFFVVFFRH